MTTDIKLPENTTVIYDIETERTKPQPEFKPANTPHCFLGDEVLNGKVNWLQTVGEILARGQFTLSMISEVMGIQPKGVALVLENDLRFLNFKAGTKLLALHEKVIIGPKLLEAK